MLSTRSYIVGASAAILLACAPSGENPLSPPAIAAPRTLVAGAEDGVAALVTGSAHRIRPLPDGELWVLAFNAVKSADGTVTGEVRVDRKDLDVSWNIDVTCVSVVGNIAWIGGIIRNATGIARDGTVSYFYVIDNGEGASDPPDEASAIRLNDLDGQDRVFCETRPLLLPRTPIAHGNVQVRSSP